MRILNKKHDEPYSTTTVPFKNQPQSGSVRKRLARVSNSTKKDIKLNQPSRLTDLELNEILKAVLGCTEPKK